MRVMAAYEVGDGRQTATAKWGKSQGKGMDRVRIARTCRRRAGSGHCSIYFFDAMTSRLHDLDVERYNIGGTVEP